MTDATCILLSETELLNGMRSVCSVYDRTPFKVMPIIDGVWQLRDRFRECIYSKLAFMAALRCGNRVGWPTSRRLRLAFWHGRGQFTRALCALCRDGGLWL